MFAAMAGVERDWLMDKDDVAVASRDFQFIILAILPGHMLRTVCWKSISAHSTDIEKR